MPFSLWKHESEQHRQKSLLPKVSISLRTRGLLLVAPWLIGLIVFKLAPIAGSLVLSFTNFFLLTPKETQFVGLQNYQAILSDGSIGPVLSQTLILTLKIIPVQVTAPIFVIQAATLVVIAIPLVVLLVSQKFFMQGILITGGEKH